MQQVIAPGQAGAIAPPAPVPAQPSAPGQKSNAWKWVVGVVAVIMLGGGCCTCLGVTAALEQQSKAGDVEPSPRPKQRPQPPTPRVPENEPDPLPPDELELEPDPEVDPG